MQTKTQKQVQMQLAVQIAVSKRAIHRHQYKHVFFCSYRYAEDGGNAEHYDILQSLAVSYQSYWRMAQ